MRFFGLAVLWWALLASSSLAINLRGMVSTDSGTPAAGALVQVYTAGPKQGTGILCPSCYLDCTKHVETAADGTFELRDLDDSLHFNILFLQEGYAPRFAYGVDASKGALTVQLKSRDLTKLDPQRLLSGRILDAEGQPVTGATIEPVGLAVGGSTQYGGLGGIDALAISGRDGRFAILCEQPSTRLIIRVKARNLAPRITKMLASGKEIHEIALQRGSTVEGVLTHEGRPLPGIRVALHQANRQSEFYLGEWRAATDAQGRFQFFDVAPGLPYLAYGEMESLPEHLAVPAQAVTAGLADARVQVALAAQPALELSGRVRLPEGQVLPADSKLLVCRGAVMDSRPATLAQDGAFKVAGLSAEELNLFVQVPGYVVAPTNAGYNEWNRNVDLKLQESKHGWELLLERANKPKPRLSGRLLLPDGQPAAGAEVAMHREVRPRFVTGAHIVNGAEAKTDAEGRFSLPLPPTGEYALVAVHPKGYLTRASAALQEGADLSLEPWSRVEGTVFRQGQPVAKASVHLGHQSRGAVTITTEPAVTDREGRFVFPEVAAGTSFLQLQGTPNVEVSLRQQGYVEKPETLLLEVPRGQTVHQDLGQGATVRGHLAVPKGMEAKVHLAISPVRFSQTGYQPDDPATLPRISPVRTRTHTQPVLTRNYATYLSPEGRFELHGLPPGKYMVNIYLQSPEKDRALGGYFRPVTLEAGETLKDLGTLTPEIFPESALR